MAIDVAQVAAQIDPLVEQTRAGTEVVTGMGGGEYFSGSDAETRTLFTRMLAAIERLTPAGSTYRQQAEDVRKAPHIGSSVLDLAGVLQALRDDYAAGYMKSIEELIHADVFADFLEMAVELQAKGFKDPAAVIAGSVLEEHLRKLAVAHGVAIETGGKPNKADTINADLVKKEAYSKVTAGQVRGWLGIRNAAAHGRYKEYDDGQVAALIRDVRAFLDRHPA